MQRQISNRLYSFFSKKKKGKKDYRSLHREWNKVSASWCKLWGGRNWGWFVNHPLVRRNLVATFSPEGHEWGRRAPLRIIEEGCNSFLPSSFFLPFLFFYIYIYRSIYFSWMEKFSLFSIINILIYNNNTL